MGDFGIFDIVNNQLYKSDSIMGAATPLEDITIEDIDGTPCFVIPMHGPLPTAKTCYKADYEQALAENSQFKSTLEELLAEREVLLGKLAKDKRPKSKQAKSSMYRHRRLAREINRHFTCSECGRSYGSEGSLRHHTKLKHRD